MPKTFRWNEGAQPRAVREDQWGILDRDRKVVRVYASERAFLADVEALKGQFAVERAGELRYVFDAAADTMRQYLINRSRKRGGGPNGGR